MFWYDPMYRQIYTRHSLKRFMDKAYGEDGWYIKKHEVYGQEGDGCYYPMGYRCICLTPIVVIAILLMLLLTFSARADIVSDINEVRVENGLSPLSVDESLAHCAEVRASECAEVWSHTRPDGTEWWTVDGLSYGENLARGFSTDEEVVEAWMASPSHRANILGNYSKVFVANDGDGHIACEFA